MNIKIDTHSHTIASGHAYSSLKEMIEAGKKQGLEAMAITEHAPKMPGTCHLYYFQNLKVIPRQAGNMKVLMGAEVNIMDEKGTLDLKDELLKKLDLVIASIHPPCYGEDKGIDENTKAYINVMKNPYVDIIGHPDDGRFPVDYEKIVKAAKEYHVLLELNNSSLTPGGFRKGTYENSKKMLELCKKYNVSVTTGSDAHIEYDVANFKYVKQVIEETKFPEELVATTSFERLRLYLHQFKNI